MNRIAPRLNVQEPLTARLLRLIKGVQRRVSVTTTSDRVVLVGGNAEQTATLQMLYGTTNVRQYNPQLGFADDPAAIEECLGFVESQSPFRFCFLAVGSPQQETLASLLRGRGVARGLTLCVGNSPNFITDGTG
jgi:N-acetylglucosaminyldiphosphoundecaprenol N-acetyl-beta-D-mannosaminyltransferase